MKRSRSVVVTLAGISLSLTGCRRAAEPAGLGVMKKEALPAEMRDKLPVFYPGQNPSAENPPLNAYDPHLGYYHRPCLAWYPYPYDYYDARWGYYRCGKWSRHAASGGVRGYGGIGRGMGSIGSGVGDYTTQPVGAPVHEGVSQGQATAKRSALVSRGGFGSTGRSWSSFFSGGS